ncbi:MAG: DUF2723 domain-containing protein [Chloroflexi bacterium]|nr:DUF2723 domain-containing protein [Chloroflexota bacterium]
MKRIDPVLALALAFACLLVYVRTLAPDVVDADGGEFQFAAWNFSFVHPTGYPLFLILGGLFQHLVPVGNPAYRLNLFTAITAALAVGMVYLVVNEFTRRRAAAVIAAALFAVSRTFWFDAGAAETYALNAFFVALLVFLALRWQAQPDAKRFALFCFAHGLALTHHRTIILWLPAFALFFLTGLRPRVASHRSQVSGHRSQVTGHTHYASRFTPSTSLRARFYVLRFTPYALRFTFYLLLPLLLYLYIPLRAPASPYATLALAANRAIALYDNSPAGFLNYVLGRVFESELGWDAVAATRLVAVPQLLFEEFGAAGLLLGGIGLVVMAWRREWARLALLLSAFLAVISFASLYHIGDIAHYYIPAYLVWAIWIGVALAGLFSTVSRIPYHAFRITSSVFLLLLTALLIAPQLLANVSFADRSRETLHRERWTHILAAPIPQDAILLSNDRDEMMPLWYIQYVENTRRDLLGLFPLLTPAPEHANFARLTDSVLDAGRPVFFVKPMPGMEIKYRLAPFASPLVRVLGRAADAPPQFATDAVLAGQVRIAGYDVAQETGVLRVATYWQPRVKLENDYTTFVHLLDARGNKVAQGNDHKVGGDFYPTSMWDIGEMLRDEQTIGLPPNIAPGSYRFVVGMYGPRDAGQLGEPVEIGTVEIR